jgi:hypothetical protein
VLSLSVPSASGDGERNHAFIQEGSHLCISDADVLNPLQSSSTRPTSATDTRKRVRVRTTHIALKGGSLAFADFHVTPPLGRSIATRPPGPPYSTSSSWDC